jgi:quinol monooxygenase YgiN
VEQLQVTAVFPAIAKEDLAEFKRLAGQLMDVTKADEGVLQYDWFFSADEGKCVVRETYASSDAVLVHLAMAGELLGAIVPLGGGIEVEVFGEPSAELAAAIESMEPAVHTFFQGK